MDTTNSSPTERSLEQRKDDLRASGNTFKKVAPWVIAGIVVLVVIVAITYANYFPGSITSEHERWGTLGDFFGGLLNPFLAFISFIALLWTIKQQNEALLISADELEFTRRELAGSNEALTRSATAQENAEKLQKQQSAMLQRQQFENSFYSLLEQHNQIYQRKDLRFTDDQFGGGISKVKERILRNGDLSMYMRMLYQLLKFITINHPDNKDATFTKEYLSEEATADERRYSSIVRSCISNEMIKLIAVNAYCELHSADEFYEYYLMLERYHFLEHIEISEKALKQGIYCLVNDLQSAELADLEIPMIYSKAFGKQGDRRLHNHLVSIFNDGKMTAEITQAFKQHILEMIKDDGYRGKRFANSYIRSWYRDNGALLMN